MDKLSLREAYAAMYAFLERRYQITESDELANILTGMSLVSDDKPVDPAVWSEWVKAIDSAKAGKVDVYLRLRKMD